jgi:hypothetical protein
MQTYNHDIVGLYNRINRFIREAMKQQSSNVSQINAFDQTRLKSYLSAIRFYHDHVQGAPDLDLPETSPRLYELRDLPEVVDMENESLADICRLLELGRDELTMSQSARIGSKLISFDSVRLLQIVGKCENFMSAYVANATPLDLPESSPRAPITGPGNQGI